MKGLNKDYPEQDFELEHRGLGYGYVIAYDLQGLLAGLDLAVKEGWQILIEDMGTVDFHPRKEVRIYNKKLEEEELAKAAQQEAERKEKQAAEEKKEEQPSEDSGTEGIIDDKDIQKLYNLGNNKKNRDKIADLASGVGVELDRTKLRSVKSLVEELERQLKEQESE